MLIQSPRSTTISVVKQRRRGRGRGGPRPATSFRFISLVLCRTRAVEKIEFGNGCRDERHESGFPPVDRAYRLRGALTPAYSPCSVKEVIQPQVPLRLPCYDFAPVTEFTLDGCVLAVRPPVSGAPGFHGVTGGVYKARERIHRGVADPRLLAIPASWGRVAAPNPH